MSLQIIFSIQGPAGWILLEDRVNGYEAHKDTRAGQQVSWRKQEITSPFVEGSFNNLAVKDTVTETLAIYVQGDTPFQLDQRVTALTDALGQLSYQVTMRHDDLLETWNCSVADYTIETPQEMMNSTLALVRATIPRRPTTVKAQVP